MPRTVDADQRAAMEASAGEDQPLVFLTISHADLATPVRVVNDTGTVLGEAAQWQLDGELFTAFPFSIELPSDTDQAPRATVEFANVDRAIGLVLDGLVGPPAVQIDGVLPSEFVTTANPRTEIGTATKFYTATGLTLREIEVNAMSIRGVLMSIDDTREPYPATRATQALLPGLYR